VLGQRFAICRSIRLTSTWPTPRSALFYLHEGKLKLTVVSDQGKDAVLAILSAGDCSGEGCWPASWFACRLPRKCDLAIMLFGQSRHPPITADTCREAAVHTIASLIDP
jgi:hypothetical protein